MFAIIIIQIDNSTMKSFYRFLLSTDRLGNAFSLTFKGSTTHNTVLGMIVSLAISTLVLIILGEKTLDMFFMREPGIQVNTRPILRKEVEDAGDVLISDYQITIGFVVLTWDY